VKRWSSFARALPAHQGRPEQVTHVIMDMSPADIAGAQSAFPQAQKRFRSLPSQEAGRGGLGCPAQRLAPPRGGDARGTVGGAGECLDAEHRAATPAGATLRILSQAGHGPACDSARMFWLARTLARSGGGCGGRRVPVSLRFAPFRKLARSVKSHWHAFLETRLTNAAIEAVNGILPMAKRMARGFRNFHYFRLAAYLKAGRLNIVAPHFSPT